MRANPGSAPRPRAPKNRNMERLNRVQVAHRECERKGRTVCQGTHSHGGFVQPLESATLLLCRDVPHFGNVAAAFGQRLELVS